MKDAATIGRPYARAIFNIASKDDSYSSWSEALSILTLIILDEDTVSFLGRPDITNEVRVNFIFEAAKSIKDLSIFSSPQFINLIKLLAENGRLFSIKNISSQFDILKSNKENVVKAKIVSAVKVDEGLVTKITKSLEKRFDKKIELELEIDSNLLGGAIIKADDMVIDGSIKNHLKQLGKSLSS